MTGKGQKIALKCSIMDVGTTRYISKDIVSTIIIFKRCNNTLPYTCKLLAPFENCLNAQAYPSGVQSCIPSSWDGSISEEECTKELACCWDPTSPIRTVYDYSFAPSIESEYLWTIIDWIDPLKSCYKPKIHLGTTIGAAVAGTIVGMICLGLVSCKRGQLCKQKFAIIF